MRRIHLVATVLLCCVSQPQSIEPAPIRFRDCRDGFECAQLIVPIDHARPDGEQITLSLLRRPAEKPAERIGILLVNPGGPGMSAVDHLRNGAPRWAAASTAWPGM